MWGAVGRTHTRRRLLLTTFVVAILFIVDWISGGKIRAETRLIGSYVWKWGVSIEEWILGCGFFSSRRGLTEENSALNFQLAQLQERAAAYRVVKDENTELRKLLRVSGIARGPDPSSGITAPIVSSFRASPYGTFQVGAGTADSVSRGDLVLSAENFVIGQVEEVDAHTALVREIFAPDSKFDGVIRGVGALVEGRGGGNARANLPRATDVQVGDAVVSAVFGGRALGVVGNVLEDSGSAYRRVSIYLPVNLSALQFVYIVKK